MAALTQLSCPECGATLRLKMSAEEIRGKSLRCPQCSTKFVAPDDDTRPVAKAKPKTKAPQREDDEDELPSLPSLSKRSREASRAPTPKTKKTSTQDAFDTTLPRSRRKSQPDRPLAAAVLTWTALGLVGALLGVGLWTAVTYFTHRGMGYLSIAVGVLAGGGVRLGAREHEGWQPGLTAVGLAMGSIFFGNLLVTWLLFDPAEWARPFDEQVAKAQAIGLTDDDLVMVIVENEVIPEFQQKGLPTERSDAELEAITEDSGMKEAYPPEVWAEAEKRWKALSPEQQTRRKDDLRDEQQGLNREAMIAHVIETEVAPEFKAAGRPVFKTELEMHGDDPDLYHPEAWAEGVKRWDAATPEQQAAAKAVVRQKFDQAIQAVGKIWMGGSFFVALLFNFGLSGFVYSILAGVMAYRVGSTSAIVG